MWLSLKKKQKTKLDYYLEGPVSEEHNPFWEVFGSHLSEHTVGLFDIA